MKKLCNAGSRYNWILNFVIGHFCGEWFISYFYMTGYFDAVTYLPVTTHSMDPYGGLYAYWMGPCKWLKGNRMICFLNGENTLIFKNEIKLHV